MKKTVIIGASPNKNRFSYKAIIQLLEKGYEVIPIGNTREKIYDIEIVIGKPELNDVDTVILYLRPSKQAEYYDYILKLAPRRIIFNPGTENPELIELSKKNSIQVIIDCTLFMIDMDKY